MPEDDERSGRPGEQDDLLVGFAGVLQRVMPTTIAGAALMAWLLQPLLPFVSGNIIYFGGLLISMGAILVARSLPPQPRRSGVALGIAAIFVGFGVLANQFDQASARYETNDVRCAGIEKEMSLPAPRRADLPDLFQAWGCRPQTAFAVQVNDPKPARRALLP